MLQFCTNVFRLGVKELWSLWRDRMMLVLIIYIFSFAINKECVNVFKQQDTTRLDLCNQLY